MSSPKIVLSFNEILFYFTRAAVGVGVPYGLAEEFAKISIWLGISGFDPAKIALPALKSIEEGKSSIKVFQTDDIKKTVLSPLEDKYLSAIQGGVVVCDCISLLAKKSYENHKFVIKNVDCPFLIAAAVGNYNSGNWEISWKYSSSNIFSVLVFQNSNWETSWSENNKHDQVIPSDVIVEKIDQKSIKSNRFKNFKRYSIKNRKKLLEKGLPIYGDWEELYYYFSRVLVPSDEKSRISGAGAGLIDTD